MSFCIDLPDASTVCFHMWCSIWREEYEEIILINSRINNMPPLPILKGIQLVFSWTLELSRTLRNAHCPVCTYTNSIRILGSEVQASVVCDFREHPKERAFERHEKSGSQSVGPGPAALTSPVNLLEMQILRPHPELLNLILCVLISLQGILVQTWAWGSQVNM